MNIIIESRRKKLETIQKGYPGFSIIDVTSKSEMPWVKFSPFYPHGQIPIPYSADKKALSVEGIWQGLKVFEHSDIDTSKFHVENMKGIKRSVRVNGNVRGHRKGIHGEELLSYLEARKNIYLPSYQWVLKHKLQNELTLIEQQAKEHGVVLLDYETNSNVLDLSAPLSHAYLIKCYLEGNWPLKE